MFKYSKASTVLSCGGIRQHFSLKENIQLSQFSAKFLREIKDYLTIPENEPPEINFNPSGYLFLATKNGADTMLNNHKIQEYNLSNNSFDIFKLINFIYSLENLVLIMNYYHQK